MSYFLKLLNVLAILGQKWVQGWHRIKNGFTFRKRREKPMSVQLSFQWGFRLEDIRLMIFPPYCYRRFVLNMLAGLSIILFVLIFQTYPFMTSMENDGIDKLMQIRQKIIPSKQDKNIPAFVLLDIDDKTHQTWGAPMFTPRDKLLNLIKAAVNAEARLVVVDIDLSRNTPIKGLEKFLPDTLQQHPYDQKLYDYIANYKAACACKKVVRQKTCPPILLYRAFQPSNASDNDASILVTRPSFLEKAVKQSMPSVQWASAMFYYSVFDNKMVRHWQLWQPACNTASKPMIVPSIELSAVALIRNGIAQQNKFDQILQAFQPQNCSQSSIKQSSSQNLQIGKLIVNTGSQGIRQRVMYSMPWLITNQTLHTRYSLEDQARETILTVFSAQEFAKSPLKMSLEALTGSIVVIGGSYEDGHDNHLTPLGEMPGALILINAIHTLLQYGEIKPLPTEIKILTYFILLIIMSFILARFGYAWGTIILLGLVILLLIPVSAYLLSYGVWLDFALPLALVMSLLS